MRSSLLRYIFIFTLVLFSARCSSADNDVTIDSEIEVKEEEESEDQEDQEDPVDPVDPNDPNNPVDPENDPEDPEEDEEIILSLAIDTNTKLVTNEAGSFSINITTNGAWSTSDIPTWIQLSAESGTGDSAITVAYDANDTYVDRISTISFICEDIIAKLSITQSGQMEWTLSLSSWSSSVECEGGDFSIDVESNLSWSVSESLDWVTVSPTSGVGDATVMVSCYENLYTTSRGGTISFSADDGELVAEYYLSQQSTTTMISIETPTKSVGCDPGAFSINVSSNTGWSVESSQSWAKPTTSSGNGNETATISYDTNSTTLQRQAIITFTTTAGENTELILTQEASAEVFIVSPTTTIIFPDSGGSESVSITSNLSWSIISSQSWVTVDQYIGSGDAKIAITASANTTNSKRTASITLLAKSGTYTRTILIEQDTSQLPQFNIDTL